MAIQGFYAQLIVGGFPVFKLSAYGIHGFSISCIEID